MALDKRFLTTVLKSVLFPFASMLSGTCILIRMSFALIDSDRSSVLLSIHSLIEMSLKIGFLVKALCSVH